MLRFIPGIRTFPVRDIDVDMADTAGSSEKRNGFFEFFQVFDILDAGFFFYAFFGIKEAEPSLGFLVRMVYKEIFPDISGSLCYHQYGLGFRESRQIVEIRVGSEGVHEVAPVFLLFTAEDEPYGSVF